MRDLALFTLLASIVCMLSCATPTREDGLDRPSRSDDTSLEGVLWWLPENTQTLIVARDIPVSRFSRRTSPTTESDADRGVDPERASAVTQLEEMLGALALGLLTRVQAGAYLDELVGRRVRLAVEGSRRFRTPRALGSMPHEGCQVLVFDEELGELATSLESRWERDASETLEMSGTRVAVFELKMESDLWRLHLAMAGPRVLLLATDAGYLRELLERRARRGANRALPHELPEWAVLDSSARYWAIRHFDPEDARLDPTSPLRDQAAANVPDSDAVGLVFSCCAAEGGSAAVTYLSRSPDAVTIAAKFWVQPSEGLSPDLEAFDGGVRISVPLDDSGSAGFFLFALLAMLGHGIFL